MTAFFNPFGWSDEDREAIRGIVRPITQVMSLASSLGVSFADKGATDTVAGSTDAAAAPDADFDQPSTLIPKDPNDMGTLKEWNTDMDIDAPSIEHQKASVGSLETAPSNILEQPNAYINQDDTVRSIDADLEVLPDVWNDRGIADPENLNRDGSFEPIASEQPIAEETQLRSIEDIKTPGPDEFDDPDGWMGPTDTSNIPPNPEQAKYDLNPAEATASTAQDQAAAVQPTDPNNTPQSNEQVGADKRTPETPEDTRGRGGNKEESKFWDLHDFSWDNLMRWLETKEGRKFFLEWGQKFTAMSGGAAPNRKKLTKKQAAAIRKKVKEKYGR